MMIPQIALFVLAAAAQPARPAADACHVLTKGEIAAVQGEPWVDAKLTTHGEVSQCFYQLPTFTSSVSVDVVRDGREFWEERFERSETEHEGREAAEADEEHTSPPRRVRGVGDEAYWVGSRMAGSLYVRKKGAVVRVSIGGKGTDEQKIAKSKKLAAKALRRL